MPGTAKLRGLKNSFDHREALAAAAEYLAFLVEKFGNLGLAAAAYNFGEDGASALVGKPPHPARGNRRLCAGHHRSRRSGVALTCSDARYSRAGRQRQLCRKTAPSWC